MINQNFTILGMYDREGIRNVINDQPESYLFLLAAVSADHSGLQDGRGKSIAAREKELLNNLGIRGNLLGYNYILDALEMIHKTPDALKNITKELYPELARSYRTQSCNIERAIRHAIEHAWNNGNVELQNQVLGNFGGTERMRPSNGEFLAAVAHYLGYA